MTAQSIYEIEVTKIDGAPTVMSAYRGKTLLIVNVASKCGFTKQYEGLEKLYRNLRETGVEVLAFPCNQFGSQEPGDEKEIANFCKLNYDVSFQMFAKIDVNGEKTHPLFQFLKSKEKGILGTEAIKWNFTKFLVNSRGEVLKRYAPQVTPEEIEKELKNLVHH